MSIEDIHGTLNFVQLQMHVEHELECIYSGDPEKVDLRCRTCNQVLMARYSQSRPLARARFSHSGYVVYDDDEDMIRNASEAILEDITSAVKYGDTYVEVDLDHTASESDIPDFLLELSEVE